MAEVFELPEGFRNQVRLFPLPDLVLFPCTAQPLHIFESRYREMLEDALTDDRLIALATLRPGYDSAEYYGRPPLADTVCIGTVTNCERTEEGTYNLLLVGLKRAAIRAELPPERSFREATVSVLEDSLRGPDAPAASTLGRNLVQRVQRLAPGSREMLDALLDRNLALSELTDVLAFHTNLTTQTKLELLGEPDPVRRAEIMLDALPARESFDGGVLPPFSLN